MSFQPFGFAFSILERLPPEEHMAPHIREEAMKKPLRNIENQGKEARRVILKPDEGQKVMR